MMRRHLIALVGALTLAACDSQDELKQETPRFDTEIHVSQQRSDRSEGKAKLRFGIAEYRDYTFDGRNVGRVKFTPKVAGEPSYCTDGRSGLKQSAAGLEAGEQYEVSLVRC